MRQMKLLVWGIRVILGGVWVHLLLSRCLSRSFLRLWNKFCISVWSKLLLHFQKQTTPQWVCKTQGRLLGLRTLQLSHQASAQNEQYFHVSFGSKNSISYLKAVFFSYSDASSACACRWLICPHKPFRKSRIPHVARSSEDHRRLWSKTWINEKF